MVILAGAVVLGIILLVLGLVASVGWLNEIGFLGFPLGFYLAAQGVCIMAIAAAFFAANRQEQIDRAYDESEEL